MAEFSRFRGFLVVGAANLGSGETLRHSPALTAKGPRPSKSPGGAWSAPPGGASTGVGGTVQAVTPETLPLMPQGGPQREARNLVRTT